MPYYINRRQGADLHTVAETESRQEAAAKLPEFKRKDPGAYYYLSTRACIEWRRVNR